MPAPGSEGKIIEDIVGGVGEKAVVIRKKHGM